MDLLTVLRGETKAQHHARHGHRAPNQYSIGLRAAFTTYGLDAEPWSARAGVGLTHTTANGTEITLRYDAEHREAFLNQTASLKARWAF